jgi:hypothetical protein
MRTAILAGTFILALAACNNEQPQQQAAAPSAEPAPAPEPQQGNTPPEDLDPFVVMIGAERWTVLLDRAIEASIEASDPAGRDDLGDLYRTDAALKYGAAQVIELRNRVCTKGLVTGDACNLPAWPAWTTEMPNATTPLAELDRRSGWLDEVMAPFVTAACESGRQTSKDELFCSVE